MISIVIPTHRNLRGLERLLRSLQLLENDFPCEVLVVANPPCDKVNRLCKQYASTIYLKSPDVGVNHARNVGLHAASYPVVLFFDDDCYVEDPLLLKKHLEFHQAHPEVLAYGGSYQIENNAALLSRVYHFVQMTWLYSGLMGPDFQTQHLIGGHVSIKKDLLQGQEFDSSIVYGGSELEFFQRLGQQGCQLVLGSVHVAHASKVSWAQFFKKARRQGRGKAYIESLQYKTQDVFYYSFERDFYLSGINSFSWLERGALRLYQGTFLRSYEKARRFYEL